jgi:DeoR/GlpR family transcriptional regulator of sugar metabolism
VASIRALNLDLLFMGVHGMDARAGFSTPNLMEAETDRVMARVARRVVVVADHTKWGTIGLSSIIALDEADVLVTDELLDEEARRALAENVGELMIAPLGARAAAER